jgi:hypothetical protein
MLRSNLQNERCPIASVAPSTQQDVLEAVCTLLNLKFVYTSLQTFPLTASRHNFSQNAKIHNSPPGAQIIRNKDWAPDPCTLFTLNTCCCRSCVALPCIEPEFSNHGFGVTRSACVHRQLCLTKGKWPKTRESARK